MSYDVHIPRCTHIKTNGTQCGSPALRGRRFCFFHKNWQGQRIALNVLPAAPLSFTMPVLEDADSVQVALMQVMRLILAGQLDPKIAGLLLYALQTASFNLRHMKLEPFNHETVVIDPRAVADNGVGDDAWCKDEFEEEDEGEEEEDEEEDSEEDEEEDSEEDEEDDSSEEDSSGEEQEEDEPARQPRKPVRAARAACPERAEGPSAGVRRLSTSTSPGGSSTQGRSQSAPYSSFPRTQLLAPSTHPCFRSKQS
jgi:hypothetical protein